MHLLLRPHSRNCMVALKTFNNLPEERKEQVLTVCLREFSLHDYDTASLSGIVSELGLAKGSFYRYFENKKSLYLYLIDYCIQARVIHDEGLVDRDTTDFFVLMLQHFGAKMSFDRKYPLHSAFLYNVLQERNNEELGDIKLYSKERVLSVIRVMVGEWVKRGQLRADLDIDTIAFMVLQTQLSIFDYIALRYHVDFSSNIREKGILYDLPEAELLSISRQFVNLLKNGIATS